MKIISWTDEKNLVSVDAATMKKFCLSRS